MKHADVHSADPEQVRRYRVAKYRVALVREGSIPVAEKIVREPADVARLMTPLIADLDREAFWVLLLDGKNKIIGINLVALGSLTACLSTVARSSSRPSSGRPLPLSWFTTTRVSSPSRLLRMLP